MNLIVDDLQQNPSRTKMKTCVDFKMMMRKCRDSNFDEH